jgi:hypothetical protein
MATLTNRTKSAWSARGYLDPYPNIGEIRCAHYPPGLTGRMHYPPGLTGRGLAPGLTGRDSYLDHGYPCACLAGTW